jgi:hypothetical protein
MTGAWRDDLLIELPDEAHEIAIETRFILRPTAS